MSNSTFEKLYTGGAYLEKNPLWHTEESSWKAENVMRMVNRHKISARTICEVGCGAGEVLKQLQRAQVTNSYSAACSWSIDSSLNVLVFSRPSSFASAPAGRICRKGLRKANFTSFTKRRNALGASFRTAEHTRGA